MSAPTGSKWIDGKGTYMGIILGGLLSVVYGIDTMLADNPATPDILETFIPLGIYTLLGGLIASWTTYRFRWAIKKLE